MKGFLIIILGFVFGNHIVAQYQDYKDYYRLSEVVKKIPTSETVSIETLSNYLKKIANTQKEQVELIYYWMCFNIDYDVKLYAQENIESKEVKADIVFKRKKTVCSGYAELFKTFCDSIGIECVIINGFAKGFDYKGERLTKTNHSWNAVKINDKWELIDVTWGAGYAEVINGTLVYKRFICLRYLFANPEDFILSHYPENSDWQLLNKQITLNYFFSKEMDDLRLNRYKFF